MRVFLIGQLKVENWSWYKEYQSVTEPLVAKYGGKYLVKSAGPERLEGTAPAADAVVVIEFPSRSHLEQWYNDPGYQAMVELRRSNRVDTELLVADSV